MSEYMHVNVALFPGNIEYSDSLLDNEAQVKLLLSNEEILEKWKKFKKVDFCDIALIVNTDFYFETNDQVKSVYADVLRYVLNDSAAYHILRRKIAAKSLYEIDLYAERVIYWCMNKILQHKIDCVIHHNTPHEVVSYIFSRVAEFFVIPIYVIRQSSIPWRVYIQKGLFGGLLELEDKALKRTDYEELFVFLKKKRLTYSDAIPDYEEERRAKLNGKFWSWEKELQAVLNSGKNPIKSIYSLFFKYRLYHFFQSKVTSRNHWNRRFVTFYLHYQPERTTLPEGDIYNQQLVAIKQLRLLLSTDINIIVREHPSTFRSSFSLTTRSYFFYSSITSLKNVFLCPLEIDSFDTVDNSLFVTTITGYVATEASIRGKCTLYFGNADYAGMAGTYAIDDVLKNPDLLTALIDQKLNPELKDVISSYEKFYFNSFSCKSIHPDELNWAGSLRAGSEALLRVLNMKQQ